MSVWPRTILSVKWGKKWCFDMSVKLKRISYQRKFLIITQNSTAVIQGVTDNVIFAFQQPQIYLIHYARVLLLYSCPLFTENHAGAYVLKNPYPRNVEIGLNLQMRPRNLKNGVSQSTILSLFWSKKGNKISLIVLEIDCI